MVKSTGGYLHRIEWWNPYTAPPHGAPRVLAEIFTDSNVRPLEFPECPPGGGYLYTMRYLDPPFFAEEMIADELAQKTEYAEFFMQCEACRGMLMIFYGKELPECLEK